MNRKQNFLSLLTIFEYFYRSEKNVDSSDINFIIVYLLQLSREEVIIYCKRINIYFVIACGNGEIR